MPYSDGGAVRAVESGDGCAVAVGGGVDVDGAVGGGGAVVFGVGGICIGCCHARVLWAKYRIFSRKWRSQFGAFKLYYHGVANCDPKFWGDLQFCEKVLLILGG